MQELVTTEALRISSPPPTGRDEIELRVETPTYSIDRFLAAVDGACGSDGELALRVIGRSLYLDGPTGAVLAIHLSGVPSLEEAAADEQDRALWG